LLSEECSPSLRKSIAIPESFFVAGFHSEEYVSKKHEGYLRKGGQ